MVETKSCARDKHQSMLETITQRDNLPYVQDEELRSPSRLLTTAAQSQLTTDLDLSYPTSLSHPEYAEDSMRWADWVRGWKKQGAVNAASGPSDLDCSLCFLRAWLEIPIAKKVWLFPYHHRWGPKCHNDACGITHYIGPHSFYCHDEIINELSRRAHQEILQHRSHMNRQWYDATSNSSERLVHLDKTDTDTSSPSPGNGRHSRTRSLSNIEGIHKSTYWENSLSKEYSTGLADQKQYYMVGEVNGRSVEAFPDSGADESFVSAAFASKLGLKPKRRSHTKVRLANQKKVQSPGYVDLSWKFDGEERSQGLKCWILPSCVHGLIIGNGFMRASNTLTKFFDRIKSKMLPSRKPKVRLLGREQQRLWGSLNGSGIAAMPDTGSDIMLVSPAVAARHNLTVDTGPEHCLEIEMADGSRDRTMGCAKDVPWTVGSQTVRADFYVLQDLSVDVVLSKDYLFGNNIFAAHEDAFFDAVAENAIFQLCNIRLIGKYGESLNILEEDWRADLNSKDAFSAEMIRKEVARRDLIRDRILELPEGQRESAFAHELDRQRLWEQLRRAHDVRAESITATGLASANENSKQSHSQRASLRLWWMRRFGSQSR